MRPSGGLVVTLLAALTGAVALLTACGAAADPAGPAAGAQDPARDTPRDTTLVVLAAASLSDVLPDVGRTFEEQHPGTTVTFSFAGSSGLVQQVLAGAPADVLVTASAQTMARAVDAGAVAGEPVVVATNHLVLAVPAGNPAGVDGLADLAADDLLVALCAEQVPCGAAAERVLDAAGVTAAPDTLEQDVRAVLSRLRLGEVDAGLVYATDVAAADGAVESLPLPADLQDAAATDYPAAVLAGAAEPAAAGELVDLLASATGAAALRRAGFEVP
ncbi:molybdate ABC transporter substrate-binding protein [Aquipuribacter sp. SD81]|uniref:molybdate ABC transporter substrate-binding protein n=1 Tax=Aquipuribacter sp. SD81 TaxID=3127703 RepID=UPI00301613DA